MDDCRCENVKLYDREWRCMQCYRQFQPNPQETRVSDYFDHTCGFDPEDNVNVLPKNALVCWQNIPSVTCHCPRCVEKHGTG